jgi:DNA-binding IclR family transcriptional regulator
MKVGKSIVKALNILQLFLTDKDEIALCDIAKATGLNRTTANRIASTLVMNGFLKQRKRRGKYSLGVRFLDFSEVIKRRADHNGNIISHLVELSRLVNESIYLTIWYGSDVMLSRSFDYPPGSLKDIPDEWAIAPLHTTCLGKIMLASMSDEDVRKYFLSKSPVKNTPNTITDINRMQEQLILVRKDGIAFEDEEQMIGVRGIAAGIRNREGDTIGAIFLAGSSSHMTHAMLEKIKPSVKGWALKISTELGYSIKDSN